MCESTDTSSVEFATAPAQLDYDRPVSPGRRTFLKVAGAGGAAVVLSSRFGGGSVAAAAAAKRCYVLVVDGCRGDEIGSGDMPTLRSLRAEGKDFPRARSLPIMETIPNHVMMMTGVRPDKNGVPANAIYDRSEQAVRDLDRPSDLIGATIIGLLNKSGRQTGTVLSKDYLYGIFGERATHRWEPRPMIPITDHSPDAFTMDAAIAMVLEKDPHFMFVNLGDVDRVGHMDLTGSNVKLLRRSALRNTDREIASFVAMLKQTGRWKHSMVIVLADHSMDWSLPHKVISLADNLAEDRLLAGNVEIAQNGGADLLYWTGPARQRAAAVKRMRQISLAQPGVLAAHDRVSQHQALRLGSNAGDVIVWCKAGWRFSDPTPVSNPIPGNHGHPATYPIPFFVAGGHQLVPKRRTSTAIARTVDVAPTVAKFFGVGPPRRGWEGVARI